MPWAPRSPMFPMTAGDYAATGPESDERNATNGKGRKVAASGLCTKLVVCKSVLRKVRVTKLAMVAVVTATLMVRLWWPWQSC